MRKLDPQFEEQVQKLHRLTVYGRWALVILSWMSLGSWGIWGLRREISLWLDHFTWSAIRYGLIYTPIPASCLLFCLAITTSVLVWQSRNILFGVSIQERKSLERQVRKIRAQGSRNPLWHWVCK